MDDQPKDRKHLLIMGEPDSYGQYPDAKCKCGLRCKKINSDRKGVARWYGQHYSLVAAGYESARAMNSAV